MRFGLGPFELGSIDGRPHEEIYDEALEQSALAEEMGFDSVWFAEQHFTAEGACPSPETLAAAVAMRTRAVRIGIVPKPILTNPLYVAEDVAVLDSISGGRTQIALAMECAEGELSGYGVPREGVSERFAEAVEILRRAWGPTEFAHDGKHWRLPGRNLQGNPFAKGVTKINVTPKPAQLEIPIWVAARGTSDVEAAARLGLPWLASPLDTIGDLANKRERYARALAAAGRKAADLLFPAIRETYVAESMEEAQDDVAAGVLALYQGYQQRGLASGLPSSFPELAKDRFLVGTPDHVIREIERYRDEAQVNYLVCRLVAPGLSHAKAMATIRFFGQAIVPEFRMVAFPSEIRKRTRSA
jgi:alkanesulfonate monooxygenase SsuD/methylene tetrahydromethanopterin reductase-like flavin-dependent oxidoreductase (luciferase family)